MNIPTLIPVEPIYLWSDLLLAGCLASDLPGQSLGFFHPLCGVLGVCALLFTSLWVREVTLPLVPSFTGAKWAIFYIRPPWHRQPTLLTSVQRTATS